MVDSRMRASNEHLPSVYIPRARGRPGGPVQLTSFYPPQLAVLFLIHMDQHDRLLKPGTLWPTLLKQTGYARDRGTILSIPTTPEVIEQSGVAFQVRVITALAMKALATAAQPNANPFLPYDTDLFVAETLPDPCCLAEQVQRGRSSSRDRHARV